MTPAKFGKWDHEAAKVRAAYAALKESDKITQEYLANRLGVTQGVVGRWLNGHKRIPDDKLLRLAVILGFDPLAVRPVIADYVDLANTVLSKDSRSSLTQKITSLKESELTQLRAYLDFLLSQRK